MIELPTWLLFLLIASGIALRDVGMWVLKRLNERRRA